MATKFRKERYTISSLTVYLVYIAQYRRPVFMYESLE